MPEATAGHVAVPGPGQVLADPGPVPDDAPAPPFLAGVSDGFLAGGSEDSWHAIEARTAPPGCATHARAACGRVVRPAGPGLQPYDPSSPPQSHSPCPECRWAVAARTGTLAVALESVRDPLAHAAAAAVLARAADEGMDAGYGHVQQLLAAVTRHEPARLVGAGCGEGDCGHGPGECPGSPGCPACSLVAGPWARSYEGLYMVEIPAPCAVLLAIAAHHGVPVPDGDGAARIAAERRRQVEAEGYTLEHDAGHPPGELVKAGALIAAELDRIAAAAEVPGD